MARFFLRFAQFYMETREEFQKTTNHLFSGLLPLNKQKQVTPELIGLAAFVLQGAEDGRYGLLTIPLVAHGRVPRGYECCGS